MRRRMFGLLIIALAISAATPGHATRPNQVTVRGGFVNEPPLCDPTTVMPGPGTPPGSFTASCSGGSPFNGGWTGHDVYQLTGTLYPNGDFEGFSDAWLYAVYTGDGTYGGIHFRGAFSIDGTTGGFEEEARIVGGTCAFKGSTGTISFTGHELYGGYVAKWSHPDNRADPTCNPFNPLPVATP